MKILYVRMGKKKLTSIPFSSSQFPSRARFSASYGIGELYRASIGTSGIFWDVLDGRLSPLGGRRLRFLVRSSWPCFGTSERLAGEFLLPFGGCIGLSLVVGFLACPGCFDPPQPIFLDHVFMNGYIRPFLSHKEGF